MDGTAAVLRRGSWKWQCLYTANGGGWQNRACGQPIEESLASGAAGRGGAKSAGNTAAGEIGGFRNRKLVREHHQIAGNGRPRYGGSVACHYRNGATFRGETRGKCRRGFASRRDRSKHTQDR